jgi:hypothetical protein
MSFLSAASQYSCSRSVRLRKPDGFTCTPPRCLHGIGTQPIRADDTIARCTQPLVLIGFGHGRNIHTGLCHGSRISPSLCRVASNFRMRVFKPLLFKPLLVVHGPSSVRRAKFLCPLFVRHRGADVKNSSASIRHVASLLLLTLDVAFGTIANYILDVPSADVDVDAIIGSYGPQAGSI